MSNLLSSVRGLLSDNVVGKIATVIGSNNSLTKTALSKVLPSIMSGIANKGATSQGASSLLNMIKSHGMGAGTLNNLTSSLGGGGGTDSLLSKGGKLNDALFGDDLKGMLGSSGLDSGSASKLMNIATPIAMGSLGKVVSDKNLDAAGLQSYLKSQSMNVVDSGSTHKTTTTEKTATAERAVQTKSGGSIMRWLIPLFFLLGAGWFFTQYLNDKNAATTEAVETTTTAVTNKATKAATHTHADGTTHAGHSHDAPTSAGGAKDAIKGAAGAAAGAVGDAAKSGAAGMGLSVDDAGNLVRDGKILLKKGEFSVKDGEYYGADGKKLNFLEKVGKAVGDAGKAVGGAVGDAGKAVGGAVAGAAGKTADAFKDVFGGMFKKKKDGGAVAAYGLSDIVFDAESHKITSFSKNEVMGLASALKASPDAKVKVQVSSADGMDKKTTKMRAQVVHDMLVTLGVADKQISAEGLGAGDGKVSILVE